jgi:hypothetical protein
MVILYMGCINVDKEVDMFKRLILLDVALSMTVSFFAGLPAQAQYYQPGPTYTPFAPAAPAPIIYPVNYPSNTATPGPVIYPAQPIIYYPKAPTGNPWAR